MSAKQPELSSPRGTQEGCGIGTSKNSSQMGHAVGHPCRGSFRAGARIFTSESLNPALTSTRDLLAAILSDGIFANQQVANTPPCASGTEFKCSARTQRLI